MYIESVGNEIDIWECVNLSIHISFSTELHLVDPRLRLSRFSFVCLYTRVFADISTVGPYTGIDPNCPCKRVLERTYGQKLRVPLVLALKVSINQSGFSFFTFQ